MSTTLTKEQTQQIFVAAARAEAAAAAAVTAYEPKAPTFPFTAPTNSQEMEDYHRKNNEYKTELARLKTQLANATLVRTHTEFDWERIKGGKKSRKSHNSKKSRKSKKSRTTYKRSRR